MLEMKNAWGEDVPLCPANPWTGEFPARAKLVSFYAAGGDYRGENAMPCPSVETMKSRMTELASRGTQGVIAVGAPLASESAGEETVGGRLGRLNALAFMRLAWDPSSVERDLRRRWAAAEFEGASDEMAEIVRATAEPTLKTLYVRSQRANIHSGVPESFARMQECMAAYGFNDCGGSLHRDALRFTPQNADAAVREKNEAVAAFEATLAMVRALSQRLPEKLWGDLCRVFEFSRDYAAIWRSVVEAYFVAGMLEAAPEHAPECRRRLATLAGKLVDAALALGENSDLVPLDGLWGGGGSPVLTGNVRSAVRVLVEMELKPRLSARDAPRARAP
jgi:hypothetical protein